MMYLFMYEKYVNIQPSLSNVGSKKLFSNEKMKQMSPFLICK